MSWLITKYLVTAGLVVAISEFAKQIFFCAFEKHCTSDGKVKNTKPSSYSS